MKVFRYQGYIILGWNPARTYPGHEITAASAGSDIAEAAAACRTAVTVLEELDATRRERSESREKAKADGAS